MPKQRRRDQLRRLRTGGRLGGAVLVLARMIDFGVRGLAAPARRAMMLGHERSGMIVVRRRRDPRPGKAVARADQRNAAGNDGARSGRKTMASIHAAQPFIKFTSSTAIEPRLR